MEIKLGAIVRGVILSSLLAVGGGASSALAETESTYDAIQDRGTLRIGVVNTPPWYYKDAQSGEWGGIGFKIGSAMAEALGVKLDAVEVKWGTSIPALQANKIDLMFFLDPTPERAKAVDFPLTPVADIALGVLVADDVDASAWDNLNKAGITVAVPQGTSMDRYVTKNLPNAEVLRFPSNAESVAAFQSGRANVACMFLPPLIMLQKKINRGKIIVPAPAHAASTGVALRAEPNKRWRDYVGTAIFYWYHTGQINIWFKETLGELGLDPNAIPAMKRSEW